jgi:hypothetical protein
MIEKGTRENSVSEDASVANAGEPQELSEAMASIIGASGPTPEELDAREDAMAGPRKPMGPTHEEGDVPPTEPERS